MLSLITSKGFEVLVLPHFRSFRASSSSSEQAVSTDIVQSSTTSQQWQNRRFLLSLAALFKVWCSKFSHNVEATGFTMVSYLQKKCFNSGGGINGTGNSACRLYPKWPQLLNLATIGTKPILKSPHTEFYLQKPVLTYVM